MNNKKIMSVFLIFCVLFSSGSTVNSSVVKITETLDLLISGGGVRPDYGTYIANYLAEMGIKVNIKTQSWAVFTSNVFNEQNFDLALLGLTGGGYPDMTSIYCEGEYLNVFGIDSSIPYGNESENLLTEGGNVMDFEERRDNYFEWQNLLMDKIVPIIPLFSPKTYTATWSNLESYDDNWGVIQSLPYMSWAGLHTGQVSTDQFIVSETAWTELNPVLSLHYSDYFVQSLLMEPIIVISPGSEPLKTGLVNDWQWLDDNRIKFSIKEDIYWNPSYNLTSRNASSAPLDPTVTPLMIGLKDGSVSNGTNQQVTTKDVIFTYLAMDSPFSVYTGQFDWMKEIYAEDNFNFVITIDGDPTTDEIEPYALFWSKLDGYLLPEFFLNSTDTTVLTTNSGIEYVGLDDVVDTDQWKAFSTMAFGCGKYMLDWSDSATKTELQASPYWFSIGAIDGTPQILEIEKVTIEQIDDLTLALAEFEAGRLDLLPVTVFPIERKSMEQSSVFEVHSKISGSFVFVAFNLHREFIGGENNDEWLTEEGKEEYTKGIAVRKAINYAIHREEMNDDLHDGEYCISDSPIYLTQSYWYYDDIIKYEYNLEVAREWLAVEFEELPTTTISFLLFGLILLPLLTFALARRKFYSQLTKT